MEENIDIDAVLERLKKYIDDRNSEILEEIKSLLQKPKNNFRYYFGIFGEAIVIFLMYAIPLTIGFLALYGLYKLVI